MLSLLRGHIAARQSIHTLDCKLEVVDHYSHREPATRRSTAHYRRSGDSVRLHCTTLDEDKDILLKDAQWTLVGRRPGHSELSAARGSYDHSPSGAECDAWSAAVLALPDTNSKEDLDLETFIGRAASVRRVERRTEGGQAVVAIELRMEPPSRGYWHWDVTILLDPQANDLVRKMTLTSKDSPRGLMRREYQVTHFKEFAPATFFPDRVEYRVDYNGELDWTRTTTFSDIRINQPLPAGTFVMKYPHRAVLVDNIKKTSYRVDADGNPLSAAVPLSDARPPSFNTATPIRAETRQEPPAAGRWILPASLGVFALAGGLYVRNRLRATRRSDVRG